MGNSLYRRNPSKDGNFKSVVKARSGLLSKQQHISGQSIQDRNPAYIFIKGKCNMCSGCGVDMELPVELSDWNSVYGNSFKPRPVLQDVSISYGGEYGLAQQISANIKCFDRESFDKVRKSFLMPGNYISARFGYSTSGKQWNPGDSEHRVSGFRVAVFSFSAGDDGTWIGSFKAVSSAEAMKTIDMHGGLRTNLKYFIAGVLDSRVPKQVQSISEMIASDAQRNGQESLDRVDASNTGYVISEFGDYSATDESVMKASMVLYTSDHLRGVVKKAWDGVSRFLMKNTGNWDDAVNTQHEIYVTLGYIVDRIVNGKVKFTVEGAIVGDDAEEYKKMKITFHKDWSKARLPKDVESGDPTSVLILGSGKASFFEPDGGTSMDFNDIKGQVEGSKDDIIALDGNKVRLDKILLHRDTVLTALAESIEKEPNESESVDPKDVKSEVINLSDFFKKLFSYIKECTGGSLALRLVLDPDEKKRDKLYVVDQNWGGDKDIDCFIFNPIDGDGSTRSCNISSNGGSNEYRTSMFLGNSKKGDTAAIIRNCDSQLSAGRAKAIGRVKNKLFEIIFDPGSMMKDKFSNKQTDAFKSVMVDLYRYADKGHNKLENINWPGMTIDLTINGAYGIIPGCAVATTQMPREWINKNIYFQVLEVTHTFAQSDWSTNIRGMMSFYDHLTPVEL